MKTRQERREIRRTKARNKMLHHGKSLACVYKNVVLKKTR